MKSAIVVGVETVVGAVLESRLSGHGCLHTAARPDCLGKIGDAAVPNEAEVVQRLRELDVHRLVLCGAASESSWTGEPSDLSALESERVWLRAAAQVDIHVTLVTSDAVFTGPRLFHSETSVGYSRHAAAVAFRALEDFAMELNSATLILRTNLLGASGSGTSWVDRLAAAVRRGETVSECPFSHASPMAACDFADLVLLAWQGGLSGVYHAGGGERVSPFQVARKLADQWRPDGWKLVLPKTDRAESQTRFGGGETSLQSRKLRRALGVSLPLVPDTICKIADDVNHTSDAPRARVA
ncbi:MAG: sugar nucleotide-binding protein [Planctomycetaceae bacterium]|nr:sugar nucleotide-binding protein [Planctomycetaceae bacterium]